jgi:hypothetical protein
MLELYSYYALFAAVVAAICALLIPFTTWQAELTTRHKIRVVLRFAIGAEVIIGALALLVAVILEGTNEARTVNYTILPTAFIYCLLALGQFAYARYLKLELLKTPGKEHTVAAAHSYMVTALVMLLLGTVLCLQLSPYLWSALGFRGAFAGY